MGIDEGIFTAFHRALDSSAPLANLRAVVRDELTASIAREGVLAQLESLRFELRDSGRESQEDVVLEVVDFVSGWSSPHMRL